MAKLHDTSVTGNINASGTIYANGKAVAPLDHTHSTDAITGLDQSVRTIVNATPVANATNATQLAGKAADQYALKSDLTALGERLNQIQYSITKVFKCPRYVSSSYDNNYVKIVLSDKLVNVANKTLIIEDSDTKFILDTFSLQSFYNNRIILKNKVDVYRYTQYSHTVPTIYRVSDNTFIVGGICTSNANDLASITLQSNEPITADDFTISARDQSYNLNTAGVKKVLSSRELVPFFTTKYIDVQNYGTLYTIGKPNTSDRGLYLRLNSTSSTVYIYDLGNENKMVLGVNGNGITSYYTESYREISVGVSGLDVYIDISNTSKDFAILGDCVAYYVSSGVPSFAPPKTLPASISLETLGRTTLTHNQVLELLDRSVIINGEVYDTKYNIDLESSRTYPATTLNDQTFVIGGTNTITARANGGNADTVGGLSPNSFITTDNLAYKYYSKVAVYNNQNHLIHPDGTEEWIEYTRTTSGGTELDHL